MLPGHGDTDMLLLSELREYVKVSHGLRSLLQSQYAQGLVALQVPSQNSSSFPALRGES